ncbi:phosphoribosylaminoimidazole-succinocarboxamide synthase [Thermaurantimonas aggregans]|uniref:Phosphoribosylaminoimidazole-succinocarboxamide synthase n=1 Tax=Thermaurantimonas aggregans TaxID=2173829 RepID=A0A401XMP9_9FLAO|nr:phosphoribosylaminoimidazolesuccinocarboxamide synthase [Thermaurantimonas aggregans]MCX8149420.1 phosphoribosylaminoimidazolesuccinocarboxamide synthase [Thermaurantimonas aggregans]GCD78284.1 phosphoribosylaminoimidazole-succinocarboxamide synthase [Thermaurantimonas aggregans]
MTDPLPIKGLKSFYRGKVRDVYFLENDKILMVASDRISAFDVILPRPIPYKGAVLNGIAAHFLKATSAQVPNWYEHSPLPFVSIGKAAKPFKIEMVVRGYLAGHAWRTYKSGKRSLCGVPLPDGLRENDPLPQPIITPTTKEAVGTHDQDISADDILARGLATAEEWEILKHYALTLFNIGTRMAAERGLILVDTKYEFGKDSSGRIILIDEVHTPDSSRYFYADGYKERQHRGEPQQQLSKEFVRQWLIENGFQGRPEDVIPEMTDQKVEEISQRYIQLFEIITGQSFNRFHYPTREELVEILNKNV